MRQFGTSPTSSEPRIFSQRRPEEPRSNGALLGFGFRVQGLGFREVIGSGFRV